eukprot:gene16563-16743_t
MSTYAGETASNLAESLESLYSQTLAPEQIVMVVDGTISPEQDQVLERYLADPRIQSLCILRLPRNVGLAKAMNAGLELCTGDYTMRMDSDDICSPDRLALQLAYALQHSDIDVVSSWSEEFFADGHTPQIKVSPIAHEHITKALHWRNVLVHPTIMARTEILRAVDGYRSTFGQLEDYDLFVRLALAGYKFHVLPKILVYVRSSVEQRARRGGLHYVRNEVAFRMECWRNGFLKWHEFVATTSLYLVFRLVSGPLRKRIYALTRS